jgi:hypothetical protein
MSLGIVFTALSSISAAFAFAVVFTFIFFRAKMLVTTRPFCHMILMISICDMMGAIGFVIGFPHNGTYSCGAQGFLTLFFLSASWSWTCMLVYQMRCALIFKGAYFTFPFMNIVSLSFPFFYPLLTLITNDYGNDDIVNGVAPCTLGGNDTMKFGWMEAHFAFLVLCSVCMFAFVSDVYRCKYSDGLSAKEYRVLSNTIFYPIALSISYFPVMVMFFYRASGHKPSLLLQQIFELFSTQYGTLAAIVFFVYCSVARHRWWVYFTVFDENQSLPTTPFIQSVADVKGNTLSRIMESIEYDEECDSTVFSDFGSRHTSASDSSDKKRRPNNGNQRGKVTTDNQSQAHWRDSFRGSFHNADNNKDWDGPSVSTWGRDSDVELSQSPAVTNTTFSTFTM